MKAYIFPGQGSQFPGMGKDLPKDLFEQANDILGFRISDILSEGTDEELRATKVTQPAVFLHSYVQFITKFEGGMGCVAGHSLGEFTALAAAGALDFADALKLVSLRAQAMQKCCEKVPGSMAAVINLDAARIEEICSEITAEKTFGSVVAANYNSDSQTVISGTSEAVAEACTRLKSAGARRALPLPVSGAFHSPLMEPARAELAAAIKATSFKTPSCPIYQNVNALSVTDPDRIKANILLQLTSPVKWAQSVRKMVSDGVTEFIECGPGTVLEGLIRKSVTDASVLSIHHIGE